MNGEAAVWTRATPWRQGHFLPADAIEKLGLVYKEDGQETCAVVVSHDCDLVIANLEAEPDIEVVVGRVLEKADGNHTWAKSTRTLHLEALRNGAPVDIELVATAKCLIPKQALASLDPESAWSLSGASLSILRSWLAARYNRASFPDMFVERLKGSGVERKLLRLIAPTHKLISAIYFDVDDGKELDRSDGTPYSLKIVLAFPPGDEPEESAEAAESLAEKIENLIAEKHFSKESATWTGVELKACLAISEDDLTVNIARKLSEWRLEYMTLKELDDEDVSVS